MMTASHSAPVSTLALALALTFAACSGDVASPRADAALDGGDASDASDPSDATDASDPSDATDASDPSDATDASDPSDATDASGEVDVVPPDGDVTDAESDPDVPVGTGTIRGSVFNNTTVTEGTLIVGLVEALPVVGEPVVSVVIEDPSAPIQAFELTDVPVRMGYWLVALLDVGEPDSLETPGAGDLFGSTPGQVDLVREGEVLENINVEVQ